MISNVPNSILIKLLHYPPDDFDRKPSVWGGFVIPKELYPKIFEKIHIVTRRSYLVYEYYSILNRIRFGPDDPDLFEKEIQNGQRFAKSQHFRFIICASMANKMDLFDKLLCNSSIEDLPNFCNVFSPSSDDPIELHKPFIDISVYNEFRFIRQIAKYYKVTSIQCSTTSLDAKLTISTVPHKDYPLPQKININRSLDRISLDYVLNGLEFENAAVLQSFLPGFYEIIKFHRRSGLLINAANLKIIAQSESICQLLRTILAEFPENQTRPKFEIQLSSMPDVLDEPVLPLADIVKVENMKNAPGLQFLTEPEQLKRLEILTGQSVSSFVIAKDIENYFDYRHVFNYLIQTKQEIPQGIDESVLDLLRMDFPNYVAKLNTKEN